MPILVFFKMQFCDILIIVKFLLLFFYFNKSMTYVKNETKQIG